MTPLQVQPPLHYDSATAPFRYSPRRIVWAILLAWIILFAVEGIAFIAPPLIGLLLRTAVSGPWLVAHAFLGTTITTNLAFLCFPHQRLCPLRLLRLPPRLSPPPPLPHPRVRLAPRRCIPVCSTIVRSLIR